MDLHLNPKDPQRSSIDPQWLLGCQTIYFASLKSSSESTSAPRDPVNFLSFLCGTGADLRSWVAASSCLSGRVSPSMMGALSCASFFLCFSFFIPVRVLCIDLHLQTHG